MNHPQLHELAHIINDHPTRRLTHAEMEDLLRRAGQNPAILENILLRAPDDADYEDEAETLAALIQKQAIRHRRIQQLMVTVSSNDSMVQHFKALGLI
jgi:ATP-dependent phosphoenolpyruvate carboxykinase